MAFFSKTLSLHTCICCMFVCCFVKVFPVEFLTVDALFINT